MKYIIIFLTALIMVASCKEKRADNILGVIKEIDSLFKLQYPDDQPGVSVMILVEDSIIFSKGYGVADMESGITADENTFYNIASVSKQFSAIALLMLEEEGKLSLDDNLKKWFPHFKADFFDKITLRHLLSHTSGIPDSRDRSNREFVTKATDVESYSYIAELTQLNFEPGTRYEYMNPTFQLMYTIVEKASGMQFEDFMRERIFSPSGMEETLYFQEGRAIPRMARGYLYNNEAGVYDEFDYGEESFFATKADGGIYTSVMEFIKWEMALRENLLVSEGVLKNAHSAKIDILDMPGHYYGYGWFIEKRAGFPDKIYHTGDNGGFQIYAARYPDQKILILIFSNRNDRDREGNAAKVDSILKKGGLI